LFIKYVRRAPALDFNQENPHAQTASFHELACRRGPRHRTPRPRRSETVVVTATRIPTPQSQIASSITVITADEIAAKQQQTLPDVLADVPGLNVVQTGGPGGQTSVFMRGTNSNHVKVLVDGIDVSDPSSPSGAFDFGQFLTPDIRDGSKSCAARRAASTARTPSAG
jgi:outer membrane cobalamin receptor